MTSDHHDRLGTYIDRLNFESTVRQVFGLIWPRACIDCKLCSDCFLVGLSDGDVRHVVRVPCALLEVDHGLTLVRAVYRAGLPGKLDGAPDPQSCSL